MSSKSNSLSRFKIILCQTSHPGNIGSAARAIKTMGFTNLVLIKPKEVPNEESNALASGAQDILKKAKIFDSIEEGLDDCNLVIGFTARQRELTQPHYNVRKVAELLASKSYKNKII